MKNLILKNAQTRKSSSQPITSAPMIMSSIAGRFWWCLRLAGRRHAGSRWKMLREEEEKYRNDAIAFHLWARIIFTKFSTLYSTVDIILYRLCYYRIQSIYPNIIFLADCTCSSSTIDSASHVNSQWNRMNDHILEGRLFCSSPFPLCHP